MIKIWLIVFSAIGTYSCACISTSDITEEKLITTLLQGGEWEYVEGIPDCPDSDWGMSFKSNRIL